MPRPITRGCAVGLRAEDKPFRAVPKPSDLPGSMKRAIFCYSIFLFYCFLWLGPAEALARLRSCGICDTLRRPGAASVQGLFCVGASWRIFRKSHDGIQALSSRVLHFLVPSQKQISAPAVLEACRSETNNGVVESTKGSKGSFLYRPGFFLKRSTRERTGGCRSMTDFV